MEKVRGWARVELIFSDKTAFLTAPNSTERTKMQIKSTRKSTLVPICMGSRDSTKTTVSIIILVQQKLTHNSRFLRHGICA